MNSGNQYKVIVVVLFFFIRYYSSTRINIRCLYIYTMYKIVTHTYNFTFSAIKWLLNKILYFI